MGSAGVGAARMLRGRMRVARRGRGCIVLELGEMGWDEKRREENERKMERS